jgi:DNA-nicking Smr family endonuclease
MHSEDDRDLFAEAMRGVKPLKHAPKVPHGRSAKRRPRTVARSSAPDGVTATAVGGRVAFVRPQVSRRDWRDLRRGRIHAEAEIDLHGMTALEARAALLDFIAEAVERGLACVRVVHGKGRRSGPTGPVLPETVLRCLAEHASVDAFASAQPRYGGTGAVQVLLHTR